MPPSSDVSKKFVPCLWTIASAMLMAVTVRVPPAVTTACLGAAFAS